jgi:hypothetical protein
VVEAVRDGRTWWRSGGLHAQRVCGPYTTIHQPKPATHSKDPVRILFLSGDTNLLSTAFIYQNAQLQSDHQRYATYPRKAQLECMSKLLERPEPHTSAAPKLAIIDVDETNGETRDGQGASDLWPFTDISPSSFHQALFTTTSRPPGYSAVHVNQLFSNPSNGISHPLSTIAVRTWLSAILAIFPLHFSPIAICDLKWYRFFFAICYAFVATSHRHPSFSPMTHHGSTSTIISPSPCWFSNRLFSLTNAPQAASTSRVRIGRTCSGDYAKTRGLGSHSSTSPTPALSP